MTDTQLQVLIIGCGNIAGGFDAVRPAGALPLTHAGAFTSHGGFSLAACVDPDLQKREAFRSHWQVRQAHSTFDPAEYKRGEFDVISICSPTAKHAEQIEAALNLKPKLIFCEKPVTANLADTIQCVQRCEDENVLFAINHTRRWAPDVLRLQHELKTGHWGQVRSVVGHYNKGILNNGSHMLDLLRYLFGSLKLNSAEKPVWDFWEDDPSIAAELQSESGIPVYLNLAHASDYAFFELQIITERGVIAMENGGLSWRIRRTIQNPDFKDYRSLSAGEIIDGEYAMSMKNAISNIYNAVNSGEPLASNGYSALQAQRLCEQIKIAGLAKMKKFRKAA